jgi:predicted nucleotidyltransferase
LASVHEGLERFCGQLREALGEELVGVILYGGLAKGEYAPSSSDVNVMVVLSEITLEALDRAVEPISQARRDVHLAALVLSEDDLRSSTDVFPVKFLDMQQHHRLLWGRDVLADLSISRDHLRLRCEQEIKNLMLRLRHFYLQRAHRPELIESTLASAISSFLTSLGAFLFLKTGQPPGGKAAVAEAAGRELGLDGALLRELLALKSGESRPDAAELKRLYAAFMAVVQQAAGLVDRFEG